jgi:hydrogenase maturation protease
MGDDAFGVQVARRMSERPANENIRIVDFGVRGLDLAFALLEPFDRVILVDSVRRGGEPGTLYLIERGGGEADGSTPARLVVVGCEPASVGTDGSGIVGLSPAVEAAIGPAIELIDSLVEKETAHA